MTRISELAERFWRAYRDDAGPASAALLVVLGILALAAGMAGFWTPPWWTGLDSRVPAAWHLLPLLVGAAGDWIRNKRPLLALLLLIASAAGDLAIGGSLVAVVLLFDAVYGVERFASQRARQLVRLAIGVTLVGSIVALAMEGVPLRAVVSLGLQLVAMLLMPITWASSVRQQAELAEAARSHADLLTERAAERARAEAAERAGAVRDERSRMARELHDAVAGDVSAVVIRAGAALSLPPGPADRESLDAIRQTGLNALAELRSMIEVLQGQVGEPMAPRLRGDGADLLNRRDVHLQGTSPQALPELPERVDRAAYRILQEALSNAERHGSGTARMELAAAEGVLRLVVVNPLAGQPVSGSREGLGLVSMAERAQAVGGRLVAGPADGHWRVQAWLPLAESPDRHPADAAVAR